MTRGTGKLAENITHFGRVLRKLLIFAGLVTFGLWANFLSGNSAKQAAKFDIAAIVAACNNPTSPMSAKDIVVDTSLLANEYVYKGGGGSARFDTFYCFNFFGCFEALKFVCPKEKG